MATLNTQILAGRDATLVVNSNTLHNVDSYEFTVTQVEGEARPAFGGKQLRYSKYTDMTGTIEIWRGSNENFVDLPEVGDVITTITGVDIPTGFATTHGAIKVTEKKVSQNEDAGKVTLSIKGYYGDVVTSGSGG